MTPDSNTPDTPTPAEIDAETSADILQSDPDAAGSLVLDGERYYPFGDLNDRARFLLDVIKSPAGVKRKALEAIGANPTLELMEQRTGEMPDELLDYVLLAVYSQKIEEIGEQRAAHGRLRSILGEPHYETVDDVYHADVGLQIAETLAKREFLKNPLYIDAFRSVPRSRFLPPGLEWAAFIDHPVPIGSRQTNSQPSTVARMIEMLEPEPGEKILDVGCGSAWTTALLRHITGREGQVYGTEIRPELVTFGRNNLKSCPGNGNAEILQADPDVLGLPDLGPYDRILVSAGRGPEIPEGLKDQLKVGGVLVMPIKGALLRCVKLGADRYDIEHYEGFRFVPLVEKGEKLVERKHTFIAGSFDGTSQRHIGRLGYKTSGTKLSSRGRDGADDVSYQRALEAYQADAVIIIDDGPGRQDRRTILGTAIGGALAGKKKEIYLVGKAAQRSEFANLPFVRTFKNTKELLVYLRESGD